MNDLNWINHGVTLAQSGGSEVLGAPGGGAPAGGESTGQAAPGGGAPAGQAPGGGGFGLMLPLLFGLMIFMIVTSMFSGRKEKKRRAEMLASVKKRDRVQTVGGIIGTVVELKGDELVLKVDEGSNTRIRFARSAVQQVIKSARGGPESIEEMDLEDELSEEELASSNR